jgi:hypothetical protein
MRRRRRRGGRGTKKGMQRIVERSKEKKELGKGRKRGKNKTYAVRNANNKKKKNKPPSP